MSAEVELRRLFLNRADNQAVARSLRLAGATKKNSTTGEYRNYASGRTRLVRNGVTIETLTAALRAPTAEDIAWLKANRGVTFIVRNPEGERFAGSYLDVEATYQPGPVGGDMQLVFTRTTFDEAV